MSFRFRRFKVYEDAKALHKEIVLLSSKFPSGFLYLRDQLRRASLSVVLNIAEGSGKSSDKDFRRYLGNALGSVSEVVACLEVAEELNLLGAAVVERLNDSCLGLSNQLGGFSKRLAVSG